jgi:hypothetical protein
MQQGAVLFDHFVGSGEHAWRDCEAERLGRLHVDDQLELGWQLHRKFGGLVALENAIDVACRKPVLVVRIRPTKSRPRWRLA